MAKPAVTTPAFDFPAREQRIEYREISLDLASLPHHERGDTLFITMPFAELPHAEIEAVVDAAFGDHSDFEKACLSDDIAGLIFEHSFTAFLKQRINKRSRPSDG